jgi:hypothetical protein
MPSNTPNFNFEYPLSSDPLADGAQSIQDFATNADTTFADLLGGTTDQLLAKNSNTNMDFKWVTFASPIVTHIAIRTADATTSTTQVLLESAADTFTFDLNKQYYFYGQATFDKPNTGTAISIDLDLNFNNVSYGDVKWSYMTFGAASSFSVPKAGVNLTTDSTTVAAATTNPYTYVCNFQGIIRTDATNTLTMQPQLVASATANITVQDYGCFIRIEEWGTKGDTETGAGGWS